MSIKKAKENFGDFLVQFGENENRALVLCSLISAIVIFLFINPLPEKKAHFFDRTFSDALLRGIDYSGRIKTFEIYAIIIFPLTFLLFFAFYKYVNCEKSTLGKCVYKINFFLGCLLPILICNKKSLEFGNGGGSLLVSASLVAIVIFALYSSREENIIDEVDVYNLLLIAVSMALILCLIISQFYRVAIGNLWLLFFTVCLLVMTEKLIKKRECVSQSRYTEALSVFSFIALLPFLFGVFVEFYYILSGYGYILVFPKLMAAGVCVFAFLILLILMYKNKYVEKKRNVFASSIFLIFSLTWLTYMPGRTSTLSFLNEAYIFELGNASASIDTVLRGKIPIVEYFSAHALKESLTKIIYGLLNHTKMAMIADPYFVLYWIGVVVVLFVIIKKSVNYIMALVFVVSVPIGYYLNMNGQSLALFPIISMLWLLEKNNSKSYLVLWISLALGLFVEYDVGFSIGVGILFTVLALTVLSCLKLKIKEFFGDCLIVTGVLICVFGVGCYNSGVGFFERLRQFLSATVNSYSIWALANVNATSSFNFTIGYYGTVLLAVILLFGVIIKVAKKKQAENGTVVLMVFCFATILNIPRTLVFAVLPNSIPIRYLPWLVAYGVYTFFPCKGKIEKKAFAFFVAFTTSIALFGNILCDANPPLNNIFDSAIARTNTPIDVVDLNSKNENLLRYSFDDELDSFVRDFKIVFDCLLEKGETFIDFSNLTSLYAFTERERPCYVAQIPGLLTDEFSQERFINEIQKTRAPLLVLGYQDIGHTTNIMGISHHVRYYKCFEYFYQEYRPLILIQEKYAIWCKKDCYKTYTEKLNHFLQYPPIDYGYDMGSSQYIHNYNLGELSYLWGNYDQKKAWNNKRCLLEGDVASGWIIQNTTLDKTNGNYLSFECTWLGEEMQTPNVQIALCDLSGTELYSYSLVAHEGTNRYLIRISSDSYWYAQDDFIVKCISPNVMIEQMCLLEGD